LVVAVEHVAVGVAVVAREDVIAAAVVIAAIVVVVIAAIVAVVIVVAAAIVGKDVVVAGVAAGVVVAVVIEHAGASVFGVEWVVIARAVTGVLAEDVIADVVGRTAVEDVAPLVIPVVAVLAAALVAPHVPHRIQIQRPLITHRRQSLKLELEQLLIEAVAPDGVPESALVGGLELLPAHDEVVLDSELGGGEVEGLLASDDGGGGLLLPLRDVGG